MQSFESPNISRKLKLNIKCWPGIRWEGRRGTWPWRRRPFPWPWRTSRCKSKRWPRQGRESRKAPNRFLRSLRCSETFGALGDWGTKRKLICENNTDTHKRRFDTDPLKVFSKMYFYLISLRFPKILIIFVFFKISDK